MILIDAKDGLSYTGNDNEPVISATMSNADIFFQVFMEKTPNLAWVVDEEEHLLAASDTFFRSYGLKKEDALNKKLVELLPVAVYKGLFDLHMKVLQTGEPAAVQEKAKWADGSDATFHINLFPITGEGGKRMIGGHALQVPDKAGVEKQLREANERLLYLSRATSNAVWEWDMISGKVFRNEALLDMIGYPMEDTKGLTWWFRRIHPEDRNRVSDKVKETNRKKPSLLGR